ncbi:MAG: hypothetical protein V7K38_09915 [Nostoc sp.]
MSCCQLEVGSLLLRIIWNISALNSKIEAIAPESIQHSEVS